MDSCRDGIPGRGTAGHFFLCFEPSESRSVWADLERIPASCSEVRGGWGLPGGAQDASQGNGIPVAGVCVATAQSKQSEDRLRTTGHQSNGLQPPWSHLLRPVFSRNSFLTMLGSSVPLMYEPNCYHKHLCCLLPPDWLLLLSDLSSISSCPTAPLPPSHQSQSVHRGPPTHMGKPYPLG